MLVRIVHSAICVGHDVSSGGSLIQGAAWLVAGGTLSGEISQMRPGFWKAGAGE